MNSTTKLSISCDTSVDPVARSQMLFSPVILLILWNTYTSKICGTKSLFRTPQRILVATGRNVFTVDAKAGMVKDTIWHERSTTVFEKRDTVYVGTLDGLYMVLKDSITMEAGPGLPQLRNRIMDIRQSKDSALWIATYSGVFCFNDGRIVSSVTEEDGLASNICRTLDIFENELWVGTNKGLRKDHQHFAG